MSLVDVLGVAKDLAEPIKAVGDLYTTDKERLDAENKLAQTMAPIEIKQEETNAIFANSKEWFNFGWQPLIGWAAGFLVILYYLPQIIITTYVWADHSISSHIVAPFPMQPEDILNLVYLLFGFGIHSIVRSKN